MKWRPKHLYRIKNILLGIWNAIEEAIPCPIVPLSGSAGLLESCGKGRPGKKL
jgi:hypothetical protein